MSDGLFDRFRGDVAGEVWPPLFGTRMASMAAFAAFLDRSQWLDPVEIEARQFGQLEVLARHHERYSSSFRDRLKAAGLNAASLASPAGLSRLPPLTRQQLQSKSPPVFAQGVPPGHAPTSKTSTSGSTGEPVVVLRTAVNRLHWQVMTMRYHDWAEPDFAGRIAVVRASLKESGPTQDWGAPMSRFFRTGPGLRIDVQTDIGKQVEMLAEFQPHSLIVYPSNLAGLLDEMDARAVDLPSLRRIRTIGETMGDALRERAEQRLGVEVHDCYSSEEVGYIALQCPQGPLLHIMSETVFVEIVDDAGEPCAPGETGRVLVTDLHNHATPLIRYEIRDHAEAGPPCSCGRGLPTIRRIRGRERNMIVNPDGSRHWPLTGFKRFQELAPVVQYQMRQHAPDRIELRLVVERPLSNDEESAIRAHVLETLRQPFNIEFSYFEGRLPRGRNGKFEEFLRLF